MTMGESYAFEIIIISNRAAQLGVVNNKELNNWRGVKIFRITRAMRRCSLYPAKCYRATSDDVFLETQRVNISTYRSFSTRVAHSERRRRSCFALDSTGETCM